MPAKARKSARKAAKTSAAKASRPKEGPKSDDAGVKAWIAAVKPEHRGTIGRIDRILRDEIPEVVPTIKYRKPSQPLGVPFYGRPGHGWVAAVWSFKDRISVGFFGGVDLRPPPPRAIGERMRLVDIEAPDDLDEKQLRAWTRQAANGQGWARV